jgi:hypothetical protein
MQGPVGRRRRRVQYSLPARAALPVVQPRLRRVRDRDHSHNRSAIRDNSLDRLELDRQNTRGCSVVSDCWLRDRSGFRSMGWLLEIVLGTLVLADLHLFRHTKKSNHGTRTQRRIIYRHRNLARLRNHQWRGRRAPVQGACKVARPLAAI